MLAEQVDGLLITPVQEEKGAIKDLKKSGLPFVLLGRYFNDMDNHYVVTDDVQGALSATKPLINQGFTKIGMINGPSHVSSAKDRFKGYKKALRLYDLDFEESLVLNDAVTLQDGYDSARKLLSSDKKVSAILCYSDFIAFGVSKAARDIGLEIPNDLAIVGYDDSFFANSLEVPLTTVKIPKKDLGEIALKNLLKLIKNNQEE